MGLIANCFRYLFLGIAEGDAQALLPGSWSSDHQWQKQIAPDGATAVQATKANPTGSYVGASFSPPIKVGDMSLRADASGDLAGDLIGAFIVLLL